MPEISADELRQLQDDDQSIGPIIEMIVQGEGLTIDTLRSLPLEARKIWSLRPTVVMQNNKDEDQTKLVVLLHCVNGCFHMSMVGHLLHI